VHISWLRLEPGQAEVYDDWTSADVGEQDVGGWAMRFLAWQSSTLGLTAFVRCRRMNFAARKRIERAGGRKLNA
jgi:hypothetical protein